MRRKEMLQYGKDSITGKMVHIRVARNGRQCDCICLECSEPLIAWQGESNQWHFAHQNDTICAHAVETDLLSRVKEIIPADSTDHPWVRVILVLLVVLGVFMIWQIIKRVTFRRRYRYGI